jgi:hypothetical protein
MATDGPIKIIRNLAKKRIVIYAGEKVIFWGCEAEIPRAIKRRIAVAQTAELQRCQIQSQVR